MRENNYNEIILFDGVCNLCNGFVQFVLKNEQKKTIRFTSLQSKIGQKLVKEYQIDSQEMDSIVFIKDGKSYIKSRAVLSILNYLVFPWNVLVIFKWVPTPLSNMVYDLIARNRYRFFGKQESCWLPTPDFKMRFLDNT